MRNKKQCGKPQEIVVKNLLNSKTLIYPSIYTASQTYFPEKSAGYLSARMFHADSIYDNNLGLLFMRSGNDGFTHNQKSFRVIDKRTGKKKVYTNRTAMLKELKGIGGSFDRQLRYFGSFKNSDVEIYPI